MIQTGSIGPSAASATAGGSTMGASSPSRPQASTAASVAERSASAVPHAPAAAPAAATDGRPSAPVGGHSESGAKAARASSQASLPPACDHRWTAGDQPPDIATASQATRSPPPPAPSMSSIRTASTPRRPSAATPPPARTRRPIARARSTSGPCGSRRASTTAGTASPASASAIAVR